LAEPKICCNFAKKYVMNTVELEAQKAWLAREVLNVDNEKMIDSLWVVLKGYNPIVAQRQKNEKRKIGLLDGKAKIVFADDWEMTTEELLAV